MEILPTEFTEISAPPGLYQPGSARLDGANHRHTLSGSTPVGKECTLKLLK